MNEDERLNLLENKLQNALMYINQANKILHAPTLDILSPLKEVRFLDTNVAATPS